MMDLYAQYDTDSHGHEVHAPFWDKFSICMTVGEIIMLVLFFAVVDYNEETKGKTEAMNTAAGDSMRKYGQFQDVHVMIFIGFGFLMTFLRQNMFQSVGMTFLIGALCIQWHILVGGFLAQAFHGEGFHKIA